MAFYEYRCTNEKCTEKDKIKVISIPMSEYNEEKLPECDVCKQKTVRNYTANAHQTFGDGYKG